VCPLESCQESLRRNGRTREQLRREFRNVHQHIIQGAHQTTRKGAYEHGEATNRHHPPIERSKVLERPPFLASTLAHSLRSTRALPDRRISTPLPSVKTRNLRTQRVQPPQGGPTFHLANIEPAHLDACACVRAWFKSEEVQKR
jgi:hypothetical protein